MHNFYVIGSPIKQSKSPVLFKYIFNKLKLVAKYQSQLIRTKDELAIFMERYQSLNIRGLNITMPLKELIFPYITKIDKNARISKSINCIHFQDDKIIGYNNDYYGFNKLLDIHKVNIQNSNNIVLGSGGSARTISLCLIKNKAKNIYILSRNKVTTAQLIKDITPYCQTTYLDKLSENSNLNKCNLINCSPIGMLEKTDTDIILKLPQIDYDSIIDINYNCKHNYFTQNAGKKIDGKSMFIFQALKSLDIWFESNISNKLSYQELEKIIC